MRLKQDPPTPSARIVGSILIASPLEASQLKAAFASGAAAVALDLRGSDGGDAENARRRASAAIDDARRRGARPLVLLAIHALGSGLAEADLSALSGLRPDGILLPHAETGSDVQHLGALLAVEEARAGLKDGAIGIFALAETGVALFGLNGLIGSSPRLSAIGWDGEALARDIGADVAREADGRWCDPCQTARTLTLAACADGRLPAIDSAFASADPQIFEREAEAGRRNGFSGKVCLNAEQVAIANAVYGRTA